MSDSSFMKKQSWAMTFWKLNKQMIKEWAKRILFGVVWFLPVALIILASFMEGSKDIKIWDFVGDLGFATMLSIYFISYINLLYQCGR